LRLAKPNAAEIVSEFEKLLRPFFERIARNRNSSHTLAALRDTLLPKLISGEIRIKDAERIAGVA
jgi:type I restriction enzyme S subunit